ncbi:hypothetical protein IAR50_001152 [Cryptococcus sp. DSM 104548]
MATSDPYPPEAHRHRESARPVSGNCSPVLHKTRPTRRCAQSQSRSTLVPPPAPSAPSARQRVITRSQSAVFPTLQPEPLFRPAHIPRQPSVRWADVPQKTNPKAPIASPLPAPPPTMSQVQQGPSPFSLAPCAPPWQNEFTRSSTPSFFGILDNTPPPAESSSAHTRTVSDFGPAQLQPATFIRGTAPMVSYRWKPENEVDRWPAPDPPHLALCTMTSIPPVHRQLPRLDQLYPPPRSTPPPLDDDMPLSVRSDAYATNYPGTCPPAEVETAHQQPRPRGRPRKGTVSSQGVVLEKEATGQETVDSIWNAIKAPLVITKPISTKHAPEPTLKFLPITPETATRSKYTDDQIKIRFQLPSPPLTAIPKRGHVLNKHRASSDNPFIVDRVEKKEKADKAGSKSGSRIAVVEIPVRSKVVMAGKSSALRAISPGISDRSDGTREPTPTPTFNNPKITTLGEPKVKSSGKKAKTPRDTSGESAAGPREKGTGRRAPKTSEGCDTCRRQHRKCDGNLPCRLCTKKAYQTCSYSGTATHPRDEPLVAPARDAKDQVYVE